MLELIETDADFKFIVKEMLRLELSLQSARLKQKESMGGSEGVTTFVILKGLHDDNDRLKEMGVTQIDGVDIAQIQNAINPSAEPKIERLEEEIARPEGG